MAWIDLIVFIAGLALGGFAVWKYKSNIQADVTTVNNTVSSVKNAATTVANDIKKV